MGSAGLVHERTIARPRTLRWFERLHAEALLPSLWVVLLLAADGALIVGAFVLAIWVPLPTSGAATRVQVEAHALTGLWVAAIATALLATDGFYDPDRPRPWPNRLRVFASAVSTALAFVVTARFVLGEGQLPAWSPLGWMFAIGGLVAWRGVAQHVFTRAQATLDSRKRVLIVGANRLGRELAGELSTRYRVVGYADNGTDLDGDDFIPLLGPISKIEWFVSVHDIDELVIALPPDRREQIDRLIARGFRRPVAVNFLPDVGEPVPRRIQIRELAARAYVGFLSAAQVTWPKRVLDLVLGTLALIVFAPLFALIAIAIKIDSPGPVLYRQLRLGQHGKPFWMLKFRSMTDGAEGALEKLRDRNEATGPLFKIRKDPRVTRVGLFLRRWSLDELPQLLNVLKGEMSLVGPRPPVPGEVERYEDWQLGRLRALPGMTGLWQVSGRSEVPFQDMVRLDLHYIRNWSLGLDVEILLRTIPAVLSTRGAY